jgi:hypothetical protein
MKKEVKIGIGIAILGILAFGVYKIAKGKKLQEPTLNNDEQDVKDVVCEYPKMACINDKTKCYNPFSFNPSEGIQKCLN